MSIWVRGTVYEGKPKASPGGVHCDYNTDLIVVREEWEGDQGQMGEG